jgi:motility quorum-sensing regulator / GCU-specific mRNA interferase toxin
MTTIHDSRLWQDVYRPEIKGIEAYVKIQIVEEATVVISFKEREG